MPKNARERCIFSLRCPKIEHIHFRVFCPLLRIFRIRWEKWGISRKNVISFKTEKAPKMNKYIYIRFWGIPKKMHMPPRAKYIVQTIFAAFQGTTRRIVFLIP